MSLCTRLFLDAACRPVVGIGADVARRGSFHLLES